jgi:protein associated with RNAse G/E
MGAQHITVNSRKYDRKIRRTWMCELVERRDTLIVLAGEFDSDVEHPGLGSIRRGTISYEYYWLDCWYNIFRFHEPDGTLRNYYCNFAMPPAFEDGVLDYVDLDIDVLVWPDGRYEVVDRDDFERNALKYDYPDEIRRRSDESVNELIAMIEGGNLPTGD